MLSKVRCLPPRQRIRLRLPRRLPASEQRRKQPAETAYNMGRAAHQLGLVHLAVPYYQSVLSMAARGEAGGSGGRRQGDEEGGEGSGEGSDLRREAAYNLALIYSASGAQQLAREVLREHMAV